MSADPLEGRERARQEFEKAAKGVFKNPPEGIDPFRTRGDRSYFWGNVESAWQLWQARGRSLEQERWISVEERLPELDFSLPSYEQHVKCMAVCESGVVAAVYERNADAKTEKGRMPRWVWYGFNRLLTGVTLWQPFPKAPAPPVHKGDS